MNRNDRYSPSNEDIFAAAVARLEGGESMRSILASVPPALRDELQDMLSIVEVTTKLGAAPVPRPSAAKRAAAKQDFLATAAQMRAEQTARITPPPLPSRPLSRPAARRKALRGMSPWERLNAGLQSFFGSRSLRLAPMIATLALVLFSTTTVVTLAQTAVPGDMAYTLKQWIRKQELTLAPAAQRDFVRLEQERELAEDVAKAANRADANSAIIQAEDTQIYYGRNGRLLKVGGLTVMDRYQPDANTEIFKPMTIEGDLVPGAEVSLAYQIMPGQSGTVQGIALTVVAPPSPEEMIPVQVPTSDLVDPTACTALQPEGWVPYTVQTGDNLTFLATRGSTSIQELVKVNCLDTETIIIGTQLYVPSAALQRDTPVVSCGNEIPAGWELYEVQPGDSLGRLAFRGDVTVDELIEVNCLDGETILIGAKLYVPAAGE
jgi:LysM repeat protein